MTQFAESDEGIAFIASAASRETSPEIMRAIAFFAKDTSEAEMLWQGDGFGDICTRTDFWERVTGNGQVRADSLVWGAAGTRWWYDMRVSDYADAIVAAGCGTFSMRAAERMFGAGLSVEEAAHQLNGDLDEERAAPLPYDPLDHDQSMNA